MPRPEFGLARLVCEMVNKSLFQEIRDPISIRISDEVRRGAGVELHVVNLGSDEPVASSKSVCAVLGHSGVSLAADTHRSARLATRDRAAWPLFVGGAMQ